MLTKIRTDADRAGSIEVKYRPRNRQGDWRTYYRYGLIDIEKYCAGVRKRNGKKFEIEFRIIPFAKH